MIDCYQQTEPDRQDSQHGQPPAADRSQQPEGHLRFRLRQEERSAARASTPAGASTDPQTCDDAAALAQKGLTVPKPAGMSDADWTKFTGGAYPIYHSTIALDDMVSKKDYARAQSRSTPRS